MMDLIRIQRTIYLTRFIINSQERYFFLRDFRGSAEGNYELSVHFFWCIVWDHDL